MKLYNTQSKKKEVFTPLDPQHVTMYVCGPTVYNRSHIGNFRPAVVFDVLASVLRRAYPQVTYARNITDIEDKINLAAQQQGVDISVITERYTKAYHQDLASLGVQSVDIEPKVTEHMAQIQTMIQSLIDQDHAYEAEHHVLFSVNSFPAYGELSKRDTDELIAGARVDVATYKRDPGDFVLWKPSADDQPGWDSPWGRGRPGWHIECSAMAAEHLGRTIDIHGGGSDLVFPHHENERAQSICAHGGQPFVRYWMHNGFVNVRQEKMSKSIGNVLLIPDLLETMPGELIRYVLLSAHYRAPLDWNDDIVEHAKNSLDRLYGALRHLQNSQADSDDRIPEAFIKALHDDLNTPQALAELFSLAKQAFAADSDDQRSRIKAALLQSGKLLGLLQQEVDVWFGNASDALEHDKINDLIEQRRKAKAEKNWSKADQIRDQLSAMHVVLEDGAEGTRWRVEKP